LAAKAKAFNLGLGEKNVPAGKRRCLATIDTLSNSNSLTARYYAVAKGSGDGKIPFEPIETTRDSTAATSLDKVRKAAPRYYYPARGTVDCPAPRSNFIVR
jgi:hypothetical protein